jgi:hypothetical protein
VARAEVGDKTWIIPAERYKTNVPNVLPSTEAVRALLGTSQKSGFVFSTTRGKRPFSGFSKAKHALDERIDELPKQDRRKPMPCWVLHDLYWTPEALCRAPGCRATFAERVLGHAGKRDAPDKLAVFFLKLILDPPQGNVHAMPARAAGASVAAA